MAYYVISDRHFSHYRIAGVGSDKMNIRNFDSIESMNFQMIKAHNSVVKKDDITIDVGDMGFGRPEEIFDIYNSMNGSFIIIKGNHDSRRTLKYLEDNNYKMKNGRMKFEIHEVGYRLKIEGMILYFTHFPMQVGDRGKIFNIHGHIHEYPSPIRRGINVSVESPDLPDRAFGKPVRIEKVIDILKAKDNYFAHEKPHSQGFYKKDYSIIFKMVVIKFRLNHFLRKRKRSLADTNLSYKTAVLDIEIRSLERQLEYLKKIKK